MADEPSWEAAIIQALAELAEDDVPSVEILLLDELAAWVLSDANPQQGHDEESGGAVISSLMNAIANAPQFRPEQVPSPTEETLAARKRLVDGAHALAAHERGIALVVTRLMPAAITELTRNVGKPGEQIYWSYFYALWVIAGGVEGEQDEAVARGLMASFDAWDALIAEGFRLPWQPSGSG